MPSCIQLVSRATGEATKFQVIDDEIREALGAPPDPDNWCYGWYDSICGSLACGQTITQLHRRYSDARDAAFAAEAYGQVRLYRGLITILGFLEANYFIDIWRSSSSLGPIQ